MLHHVLLGRRVRFMLVDSVLVVLVLIVSSTFACKVGWSFVFVCAAAIL